MGEWNGVIDAYSYSCTLPMVNADCKPLIGLTLVLPSQVSALLPHDTTWYIQCTMKFPKVGVKECESGLLRKSAP